MSNEASVPLKTRWDTVEQALKDGNQGICPPTPVCALVEDSSQNIYACIQVGCTPVAREHPQAESQVIKVRSPCHLSVVPRQYETLAVSVTNYCIILTGLNTCRAFLKCG